MMNNPFIPHHNSGGGGGGNPCRSCEGCYGSMTRMCNRFCVRSFCVGPTVRWCPKHTPPPTPPPPPPPPSTVININNNHHITVGGGSSSSGTFDPAGS